MYQLINLLPTASPPFAIPKNGINYPTTRTLHNFGTIYEKFGGISIYVRNYEKN